MESREKQIYRITLAGSIVNGLLVGLKLVAGILGRSSALVADAVHSLTDFVSDIIVLVFVHIAAKLRDREHRYGHGKYETMATMVIGVILVGAGVMLLVDGGRHVYNSFRGEELPEPSWLALAVALVSIVAKEVLFRSTIKVGKNVNSDAVLANAWHHRSDSISSLGTAVGIGGAILLGPHWRVLDPLAAMVVSLFIIKAGFNIVKPAVNELLESSLPAPVVNKITEIIRTMPGVDGYHNLRTRKVGNTIVIDVHLKMNGNQTLREAHDIATRVESEIKSRLGDNSFINIHMEPK